MSYIEKEKLIKADIASIENRVRHAFNQGYDLGYKEGKERAKSQEQEPKPMVEIDLYSVIKQKYIEREVLDKLRAEIDKIYEREGNSVDCLNALDELKWFIDKYKAKSEPQESEG